MREVKPSRSTCRESSIGSIPHQTTPIATEPVSALPSSSASWIYTASRGASCPAEGRVRRLSSPWNGPPQKRRPSPRLELSRHLRGRRDQHVRCDPEAPRRRSLSLLF